MFHRLRNSAMLRRNNRQSGRHRFEDGIGNSLLVLIGRSLARMQEKMTRCVKLQQFLLRKKSAEVHVVTDAELCGKPCQLRLQRSLAGDEKFGVRKFSLQNRECAKGSGDAFLRDETAGLQEIPVSVHRRLAAHQRKFA